MRNIKMIINACLELDLRYTVGTHLADAQIYSITINHYDVVVSAFADEIIMTSELGCHTFKDERGVRALLFRLYKGGR